jgi:23S rRNA pseudouridine1911/1915/1917 synthase
MIDSGEGSAGRSEVAWEASPELLEVVRACLNLESGFLDPYCASAVSETDNQRLDKRVAEQFGVSRTAAQEAVRTGRVDVDGERCDKPGRMVAAAAAVIYDPNRPKARRVVGVPLKVLYEDRHVLIVDKPPGILTLPTAAHEPDTLAARADRYLGLRHKGDPFVGIIHRLDRDTSGAIAFAKTVESLEGFQALFRAHAIERQYLAVVEGKMTRQSGTIDRRLVVDADTPRRRVARRAEEGVEAVTHYQVVERFGPVATLIACWLETGRTHQIRLHLASVGHPVVGDQRYRHPERPRTKARFHRQALHAQTLGFTHPITGQTVRVEAPPPADLAAMIVDLRNRYGLPNAGG